MRMRLLFMTMILLLIIRLSSGGCLNLKIVPDNFSDNVTEMSQKMSLRVALRIQLQKKVWRNSAFDEFG